VYQSTQSLCQPQVHVKIIPTMCLRRSGHWQHVSHKSFATGVFFHFPILLFPTRSNGWQSFSSTHVETLSLARAYRPHEPELPEAFSSFTHCTVSVVDLQGLSDRVLRHLYTTQAVVELHHNLTLTYRTTKRTSCSDNFITTHPTCCLTPPHLCVSLYIYKYSLAGFWMVATWLMPLRKAAS